MREIIFKSKKNHTLNQMIKLMEKSYVDYPKDSFFFDGDTLSVCRGN